jgi:hypothetical protein
MNQAYNDCRNDNSGNSSYHLITRFRLIIGELWQQIIQLKQNKKKENIELQTIQITLGTWPRFSQFAHWNSQEGNSRPWPVP